MKHQQVIPLTGNWGCELRRVFTQPRIVADLLHKKTASEEAAFEYILYSYAFFLLAIPIKPIRPEPNSQTAAGIGTTPTETSVANPSPS